MRSEAVSSFSVTKHEEVERTLESYNEIYRLPVSCSSNCPSSFVKLPISRPAGWLED